MLDPKLNSQLPTELLRRAVREFKFLKPEELSFITLSLSQIKLNFSYEDMQLKEEFFDLIENYIEINEVMLGQSASRRVI